MWGVVYKVEYMTKLQDDKLHKKILELDDQMRCITDIISKMVDKMDTLEQAASAMRLDLIGDLDELKDGKDIDPEDRNT